MAEFVSSNRAVIILRDGKTPTPTELEVDCDQADFTVSGFGAADGGHAVEKVISRGQLCGLVEADPVFPAGSFSLYLSQFTGAGAGGKVADFVRRTGTYATNVGTRGEDEVYTIEIEFKHTKRDGSIQTWLLEDCLVTLDSFTEGRPATLSFSFECLGAHSRTETPAA